MKHLLVEYFTKENDEIIETHVIDNAVDKCMTTKEFNNLVGEAQKEEPIMTHFCSGHYNGLHVTYSRFLVKTNKSSKFWFDYVVKKEI